jgi:hypothetical protein
MESRANAAQWRLSPRLSQSIGAMGSATGCAARLDKADGLI